MAAITESNAQDLAVGSFSAFTFGAGTINVVAVDGTGAPEKSTQNQGKFLLSTARAAVDQTKPNGSEKNRFTQRVHLRSRESFGECGGSLKLSMEVDDTSGLFTGTFSCNDFCREGVTLSGEGSISGVFDLNREELAKFRMTFPSISISEGARSRTMSGWVDSDGSVEESESVQMDVLLKDDTGSKGYWLNNIMTEITHREESDQVTRRYADITGRYYDTAHGYVDFQTVESLMYDDTEKWPQSGVLVITGSGETSVRISFTPSGTCRFDGDFNGDGETDWTFGYSFATSFPSGFLNAQWEYGLLGAPISENSLDAVDIDNDGSVEIIAANSSRSFWCLASKTDTGGYEQIWMSPVYESPIASIQAVDMDKDGFHDIYVGLNDGTILVYQCSTVLPMLTTFTSSHSRLINAMAVGDINGNGFAEIVTSDGTDLDVYSADTHNLLWSGNGWGGDSLAIGNVDGDPTPEIVVTRTSGNGYVVDGMSQSLDRELLTGCGKTVRVGDLDDDGIDNIISMERNRVTLFNGDDQNPSSEIPVAGSLDVMKLADVDGDHVPEIIYNDAHDGVIHCHKGDTLQELWTMTSPIRSVSDFTLGDLSGDGGVAVLWAADDYSSGAEHFYVADPQSGDIEWKSTNFTGPLSAVDVGDVDGDGQDEIVMASSYRKDGSGGAIQIIDARTHLVEWSSVDLPDHIDDFHHANSVKLGDVDGDGHMEIVIAASRSGAGKILVYDGSSHVLEGASNEYRDTVLSKLALGDVDNDGHVEIVVGQGWGNYISVFNGRTVEEEWQSDVLSDNRGGGKVIDDILLADVDKDGNTEIIASVVGEEVIVLDGVTHAMDWRQTLPALSLAVADIDADGTLEILVGTANDGIVEYDGVSFIEKNGVSTLASGKITALSVTDLNGDGKDEVIVGTGNSLTVTDIKSNRLIWQSETLGDDLARYNQLICRDTNDDGLKEIVAGSSAVLYHFK